MTFFHSFTSARLLKQPRWHSLGKILLLILHAHSFPISHCPAASSAPGGPNGTRARRLGGPTLLEADLAPGRLLPQSSFYDFLLRVSPSVGLEYQLSPKFTLSGEVEADTTLPRHQLFHGNSRRSLVPTAGTGLMLRYYYYWSKNLK